MIMKAWLGTALGSLIFGWAALVSSVASAQTTTTYVIDASRSDPQYATGYAACSAAVFASPVQLGQCVTANLSKASIPVSNFYNLYYLDASGECKSVGPGAKIILKGTGTAFSWSPDYQNSRFYQPWPSTYYTLDGKYPLRFAGCSYPVQTSSVDVILYWKTSTDPVKDPEDTDKPKECVLNEEWGRRGLPQRAAGYKPMAGNKFKVAYRTDFAMPATVTDGGTTAPGHLFEVDMGDNHACTFRRQTRVHLPADGPNEVGTMVYTVDYFPRTGGSVGDQGSGSDVPDIVVKANTKVSKPIIKFGTRFDMDRLAKKLDSLERAYNQAYGASCGANCRTTDGQAVPVTVQARQEVDSVPYVHPAPSQLARDNPDCTANFDPRCAFSPSPTQPVTAATPPDTLVRISNDGTNIVKNDTTVYNNTVYPTAMRNAGTAPSSGVPGNTNTPGSVDQPGTAEEGEGGGAAMIDACRASGECSPSDEKVAAYLDAIGVDRNKDTSPDGVASSVIDKAMGNGTCTSVNQNAFCSLAAGFGARMNRPVPSGDLILSEGDIKLWDRTSHQKLSIPRKVIDILKVFLKIITTLSIIHIVLRGRPF